jgi:hypothetical protein
MWLAERRRGGRDQLRKGIEQEKAREPHRNAAAAGAMREPARAGTEPSSFRSAEEQHSADGRVAHVLLVLAQHVVPLDRDRCISRGSAALPT